MARPRRGGGGHKHHNKKCRLNGFLKKEENNARIQKNGGSYGAAELKCQLYDK
jgi:hypothetical protein